MSRDKIQFRRGKVTLNLVEEERVFLINSFKKIKPKTDLEKRIVKRALHRLMGSPVHNIKLYPNKECKICHREIAANRYDEHFVACTARKERMRLMPKIDPAVLEMVNRGL